MGCSHETRVATQRILSNGTLTVSLQCQKCGSGLAARKDKYQISTLPPFDESISVRYKEQLMEELGQQRAQFLSDQESRSGQWWVDYNSYLASEHWKAVRRMVINRDRICQKCFTRPSDQAHHLSYYTYNRFGFSFPAECVGLCRLCHEIIHLRGAYNG